MDVALRRYSVRTRSWGSLRSRADRSGRAAPRVVARPNQRAADGGAASRGALESPMSPASIATVLWTDHESKKVSPHSRNRSAQGPGALLQPCSSVVCVVVQKTNVVSKCPHTVLHMNVLRPITLSAKNKKPKTRLRERRSGATLSRRIHPPRRSDGQLVRLPRLPCLSR